MAARWPGSSLQAGLIEFVCRAHAADERGPTITPLYGRWSYCPGFARRGHDWRQIEPVTRERLERYVLAKREKASRHKDKSQTR
ncbi:MAG TPA: hypothetical protein VGS01_14175 [Candidatus Limnocylindria bacterium]|nr:hypothetical protein [Candidatus Limnocylindria bacterium]